MLSQYANFGAIRYDLHMGTLARDENLQRLRDVAVWDLVVIGGGATGLGSALDACSRGYRTLLLEAQDFAHGTSSRSTKLIHGGVRYLAQGNVALVREALHERGILLRNAPHLVHSIEFVVPAYKWRELPYYGAGLKVYDALSGRLGLGRSRWISAAEVTRRVPTVRAAGLKGGIVYADGQFDDARLAIALARTFADLGGSLLNYVPVTGFLRQSGRISGVLARDSETGEEFSIAAKTVINATGVCVDQLRQLDDAAAAPVLTLSQGAHVVLDRSFLPGSTAILVPRTDDGRVLFAIPWHNHVLVGTTDTPTAGLDIEPRPLAEEVEYLTEYVGRYLDRRPSPGEILSRFAGLRPLLKGKVGSKTSKLSREHAIVISTSGLVTVTGGKWTTYRRMGADAVNHAARQGNLPRRPSTTEKLRLHGWCEGGLANDSPLGVYGSDAGAIELLAAERPEWSARLHPALPYRGAEVVWGARQEGARLVQDVLARRTRALFLNASASAQAAATVARLLATELGKDAEWEDRQVAEFRELAAGYIS
jgi:glycerol-3-phosphate dehydrogenase